MQLFERIKEVVKVLFVYDEEARVDLFEAFPAIKRFYRNRHNLFYLRTFGDISFSVIIIMGLFGPQDQSRNVSLFLAWGIWWVTVVMSWFFMGRSWCGICPFPGVGRVLQMLGLSLNREPSVLLTKYRAPFALIFFALIIWVESVTAMKSWPLGTALLLLSILLGASVMAILFRGQSWCRYLCPMGKIIGAAATLSMIELRPDLRKCKTCRSFSCKKGTDTAEGCPVYLGAFNIRNNIDCLMCGRCVYLCDQDGPRLNLRNPFVELVINKGRSVTCSYIIPFLIGSQLARFIQHTAAYRVAEQWFFGSNALAFTVILGLGFIFALLVIRIGAYLFRITEDPLFGKFSPMVPVFVPLAFTGELAYRLDYFLVHIGNVLPTFGRQFGFKLEHLQFSISTPLIYWTCLITLCIGAISSSYVLHLFNTRDFEDVIPKINYYALHILVLFVFVIYAFLL
ncbi:MAG: 4Fe-4S binding protein [Desulfobulbaceae bacterium]|nr:4Fe-4S binding protein [Desulfobulbaceae bacterium]